MSDEQNQQPIQFNLKGVMIVVTLLSIIFSAIPSLIYWLLQRNSLGEESKLYLTNLLNFQITMFIIATICGVVFSPLLGIVSLVNLILLIIATVKLNKNEFYKFPLTIELIK